MRKFILSTLLVLVTNVNFAQTVFDKFENQDEISTVIVDKKMFSLLGKMEAKDAASQQYVDLVKRLDQLKVFVTKDGTKAAEMKNVSDRYTKSASLEELMHVSDKGERAKIYVKSGASDSQIKELLMFIDGGGKEETVLMSLTGDFNLNELAVLTDKMKLPGGEELKKASKAKVK